MATPKPVDEKLIKTMLAEIADCEALLNRPVPKGLQSALDVCVKAEAKLAEAEAIEAKVNAASEVVQTAEATLLAASAALDAAIERGAGAEAEQSALAVIRAAEDALTIARRRKAVVADRSFIAEARDELASAGAVMAEIRRKDDEQRVREMFSFFHRKAAACAIVVSAVAHRDFALSGGYMPRSVATPYDVLSPMLVSGSDRDGVFASVRKFEEAAE